MADQWFLDLDGVRSGPYQTPEVMALVAEGEVLPHHRISRGLKDQKWLSILDWRLEQAKAGVNSSVMKTSLPKAEPPPSEPIHSLAVEDEPEAVEPPPPPLEEPAAPVPEPKMLVEPPPVIQKLQEAEAAAPHSKRDPTAEMFEMLQNTKQRREKQNLRSSGITVEPDTKGSAPTSGFMKMALVGLGVIFLGFGLGQLFQSSKPPVAPVREVKVTPTPEAKSKVEVVDRSTDKMIIRSKIERNMDQAAASPAQPKSTPPPVRRNTPAPEPENTHSATVEKRVNEKEMEELKDLKRELLELKALKEQVQMQEMLPGESGAVEVNAPGGAEVDDTAPAVPLIPGDAQPTNPGQQPGGY